MGVKTNIAWTESTLNLAWGCTKVTRECTQCYMYRQSEKWGLDPTVVRITKAGSEPKALELAIRKMGSPMFVNSMSDTFHKDIPDGTIDRWFAAFQQHPEKQFQILTKRPERARTFFEKYGGPPDNCWMGTSCGIMEAKLRLDELRRIKARIRFVSFEPLLEDLGELDLRGIAWGIIGGESDDKDPREMRPEWAESVVAQLKANGAAVFFKQMGGKGGSGAGGSLLNGRSIKEMPE